MTAPRSLILSLPLMLAITSGCEGGAEESAEANGEESSGDGDGDGDGDADIETTDEGLETTDEGVDTTAEDTGNGMGDGPANTACDAFVNATPEMLTAATSAGEAATASVVPDPTVVYTVALPEGAAGFIELQIPDWETTQAFFTTADIEYTVTVESNSQVPGARELDAACPDAGITDQRIFFPHWTPATVEFSAEGPREVPLMIIQQP